MSVVIFWSREAEGRGEQLAVCHKPETLSPERRAQGIEAAGFAPPAPETDWWGWQAHVDLKTREPVWEPVAKPNSYGAFRRLFSFAERGRLTRGTGLSTHRKADLAVVMADLASLDAVRLDDPEIVAAVNRFAELGLIAPERARQVLRGEMP